MARTHLFVDTNVFLDFYSYAKDDLSQLRRLKDHLTAGDIRLHLPQHVINELERNREIKLKTSADQFRKESFPTAIPRHMQDYSHAGEYSAAVTAAFNARTAMINQAAAEASSRSLAADKALEELIEQAIVYVDDDSIFAVATQRMQKGNPPGKPGSVGDQYNWECLLAHVPEEDLHIVSKDGDYASSLNPGKPHPFLAKEWKQKKNAGLHVYGSIRPFLDRYLKDVEDGVNRSEELPAHETEALPAQDRKPEAAPVIGNIEIVLEGVAANVIAGSVTATTETPNPEKQDAIDDLANSRSFYSTHDAVAKLEEIRATLTKDDVETLVSAAIDNPQVTRIASDSDVYAFFTALLSEHSDIDAGLFAAAAELFGQAPDDEDNDPLAD